MTYTTIDKVGNYVEQEVLLKGWLSNIRSSGKICFLRVRDGFGFIQAVAVKAEVGEQVFDLCKTLTQESSIEVYGIVKKDDRAPSGFELTATNIKLISLASENYPISNKEHGVEFLMDNRHLWLRTPRQVSIMRIRAEICRAVREFFDNSGFVLIEPPIITPSSCEGTSNLFELEYFGEKAFLSQTGQLYAEALALALGKVYSFGPTFRAERHKTRRHLNEFWMVEPEAAFVEFEENLRIQENLIEHIVQSVLKNRMADLKVIGGDVSKLENIKAPFDRLSYDDAVKLLNENGIEMQWGEDFGSPEETFIANQYDKPVFITKYPAKIKAFYMKPDKDRPEVVLNANLLANEGYGEIIGGSERESDLDVLIKKIEEEKLPREIYEWYLDLRKYGSVPHSGFGLGIERAVTWICGLDHVREAIAFPRMLNRVTP